jgi:hypoxanthine phosphoribosyltransferase
MNNEKYYYTWEEFDKDIEVLAQCIKFTPELIIGIARGGLVPGVALSHKLKVPFNSITWQDRDGGVKEKVFIPDHTLVVDDINDTGLTFQSVTSGFNTKFQTVSLWERKLSKFTVDFTARRCDTEWIVFPWEEDE